MEIVHRRWGIWETWTLLCLQQWRLVLPIRTVIIKRIHNICRTKETTSTVSPYPTVDHHQGIAVGRAVVEVTRIITLLVWIMRTNKSLEDLHRAQHRRFFSQTKTVFNRCSSKVHSNVARTSSRGSVSLTIKPTTQWTFKTNHLRSQKSSRTITHQLRITIPLSSTIPIMKTRTRWTKKAIQETTEDKGVIQEWTAQITNKT